MGCNSSHDHIRYHKAEVEYSKHRGWCKYENERASCKCENERASPSIGCNVDADEDQDEPGHPSLCSSNCQRASNHYQSQDHL